MEKEGIPFTMVANSVLGDKSLSFKAKGLFAYIYSKPNGWDFAYRRICQDSTDGKESVLKGLQELAKSGYLTRKRLKTGKVTYNINYDLKAKARFSHLGKSQAPIIGLISNKDNTKIEKYKKKDYASGKINSYRQSGLTPIKDILTFTR